MDIYNILVVFISGFLCDILWAAYINSISNKEKIKASVLSVFIGINTLIVITEAIGSLRIMIFWLLGLFFGTYFYFCLNKFNKKVLDICKKFSYIIFK